MQIDSSFMLIQTPEHLALLSRAPLANMRQQLHKSTDPFSMSLHYIAPSLPLIVISDTLYSCSSRRLLPFDKSLFSLTLSLNYSHLMRLRWVTLKEAYMAVLRKTTEVVRLLFFFISAKEIKSLV